jgi:hypothetical protein
MPKPAEESVLYGVKVTSEMPIERLQGMRYIALYNTTNSPAELTCKFGLSAISIPSVNGYLIKFEEGEAGIHLGLKSATIRGSTESELLMSCHVFACLRDGIECPNFLLLESFIDNADSISIILDSEVDQAGGRGYAELVGALSFIQSKRADRDGDGILEQAEVDANEFFIYPFIKEGDLCTAQPLNNMIQNWSRTNETVECARIAPSISLVDSDEQKIEATNERVILYGNGDKLHTSAIIVRDHLIPEWIRRVYGLG